MKAIQNSSPSTDSRAPVDLTKAALTLPPSKQGVADCVRGFIYCNLPLTFDGGDFEELTDVLDITRQRVGNDCLDDHEDSGWGVPFGDHGSILVDGPTIRQLHDILKAYENEHNYYYLCSRVECFDDMIFCRSEKQKLETLPRRGVYYAHELLVDAIDAIDTSMNPGGNLKPAMCYFREACCGNEPVAVPYDAGSDGLAPPPVWGIFTHGDKVSKRS